MSVEELIDRYEQPVFRGALDSPPARSARRTNPRCGDIVTMFALVEHDRLVRVRFDGSGCTVSQAAADLVAELTEGRSVSDAQAVSLEMLLDRLGIQTRHDCAGLALLTLKQALE